jgi:hypothetical protein
MGLMRVKFGMKGVGKKWAFMESNFLRNIAMG